MNPVKNLAHRAGRAYIRHITHVAYSTQKFERHNERPIEYGFALRVLAQDKPKSVLDVGTGETAWPHLLRNCGYVVTAIDNVRDYWPEEIVNRHWEVLDHDITAENVTRQLGRFDAITCISVLEHIADHVQAVRNMAALLNPTGLLILTTPYSEHHPYPDVFKHPQVRFVNPLSPLTCRSSSRVELEQWLATGLSLERKELWRLYTGEVWDTGQVAEWKQASEGELHQLGLFVFRRGSASHS